jgi:hypothetical protein
MARGLRRRPLVRRIRLHAGDGRRRTGRDRGLLANPDGGGAPGRLRRARLDSGCTSGHGLSGIARFSKRSVVATLMFMGVAMLTVFLSNHVL